MHHPSRSILASFIALAFVGGAHAADKTTVENITFYKDLKADSAKNFLQQNAAQFGLPVSLENLVLTKTKESLLGKHYYYQQVLRGIPVDRAEIIVSIGKNGELLKVFNETKPISVKLDRQAAEQLSAQLRLASEQALDRAWSTMKVQHPLVALPSHELVWFANKDELQLAYKVDIAAQMPTGGFVQYIHAHNGSLLGSYTTSLPRVGKNSDRVLDTRSTLFGASLDRQAATQAFLAKSAQLNATQTTSMNLATANGSGLVFDPDPRTALQSEALTDTSSPSAFDAAYSTKTLRDLTVTSGVYKLTGPYITITDIEAPNTAPSTTTNGVWNAKRGNDAFDDTNVYFHLDQNQRYIQSLGFTGSKSIINRPFRVDTNGVNGDDNSHYSGGGGTNDYLAFGHGCVNDSEDTGVILHEYGHGIQANINSNWGGGDTGAMGEGFGDYWAGSYAYSTPNGKTFHPEWVFKFDGHNACWAGRMLNRTDARYNSSKSYGAHSSVTEGSVTFQSDELWSAPLVQSLMSLIAAGKPRENVDKIILEAHFGLGSNIKMPAMATAIVNAAHNLFPTESIYGDTFKAKFQAQNILSGIVTPPVTTPLTNNVPVTGVSLALNAQKMYSLVIPSGATSAKFQTSGGTGDVDIYVQKDVAATKSVYLQKSDGSSNAETITLTNPAAGTYYLLVNAYAASSGLQVVGSYTTGGGNVLSNGVPVTGIALAKGASKVYTITVPAGRPNLVFKTTGGTGDIDIYSKLGSAPTTTSYTQKSDGATTVETITITSPVAGTYYVLLNGYAASSGVSLTATY